MAVKKPVAVEESGATNAIAKPPMTRAGRLNALLDLLADIRRTCAERRAIDYLDPDAVVSLARLYLLSGGEL